MRHTVLLSIAVSIFALAAAVVVHAQTGRYQIAHVTGLPGVYKTDTKTGEIYICSPAYAETCITMADARAQIVAHQQKVQQSIMGAGEQIDQFTKEKAQGLNELIRKFVPQEETQPQP